jgi:hypothetical protein
MSELELPDGYDVILPKGATTITLELMPEDIELAFATEGRALCLKTLKALVIAMVNDSAVD